MENTSLEITQRLLVRRLAVICGHGNTADAQLVDAVADALESGAWFMAGIKSPEHFVAWQTGSSSARSHHVVAVARRREELPATYGLFAHGELSLDQIAVVAAHAPSWADAEVATFAKHATVSQLRHALRKYPWPAYLHLDTDGAWLNAGPALPRSLFEHVTCDGVVQPVWEREGRAVNIGRVKQIVPDHTRRIVVDRDRSCRHPGCNGTRHRQVHHVRRSRRSSLRGGWRCRLRRTHPISRPRNGAIACAGARAPR